MPRVPRIIVVDDEERICFLLQRLLERDGYEVRPFLDAGEALNEVVRERPDLVITDIKMPGMTGMDLLKRMRTVDPDLPVVLITAFASMETAIQALREGAADYITKPFSIDELKTVVGRILENRALTAENRRLLQELRIANAQLQQHRARLRVKVKEAEDDLLLANRTLERRLLEMEVIHEINQLISKVFDLDQLLTVTTQLVRDKVGAGSVAVFLLDPEGEQLTVHGVRSPRDDLADGDRIPKDAGAAGFVLASGTPLLLPALPEDTRPSPRERATFGEGSLLLTPIPSKQGTAGVLAVGREPGGGAFAREDSRLLALIGNDLGIAVENVRLFQENERNYIEILASLVVSMEARDPYLRKHSERVCATALAMAAMLNLPEQDRLVLETGARLHDLGKVGIEDRILRKASALTEEEWAVMRSHPVIGDRIVRPLGRLRVAKPIIRHHHERWDGGGYPDGIAGEEIPLLTQIVTVADAFDAMTSRRPYRDAMTRERALQILGECSGTQFNPFLVEVLGELRTRRP